jgi:uncharacterized protein (TIGR02270 family)
LYTVEPRAEFESKSMAQPDHSRVETARTPTQLRRPLGLGTSKSSAVIDEVIEQHAEEAAFLWTARDRAVFASSYSLRDISALDERVEAHLDGLRVAGPFGWQICDHTLEHAEPGVVFAAAVLAFDSGDTERIRRVLEIGCLTPELQRGLTSALGWLPFSKIEADLKDLLDSKRPEMRCIGIAAFAAHRRDPGQPLTRALSDPDAGLRVRALKACAELGRADLLFAILPAMADEDEECRFLAAWSAARLGDRSQQVVRMLQEIAIGDSEYAERALGTALRIMNLHAATPWYQQLKTEPAHLRAAAAAAGTIGGPEFITDLINLMKNPPIARVAGEAFSMITGLNLAYENLSGDAPEGFETGPIEDPEDGNVSMDPDENLPWPAPDRLAKWWNQHRAKFQMGRRYLRGKEISIQSLHEVLIDGNQRERDAAALELAIKEPTQPLFAVQGRASFQLEELKRWK